MHLEILDLETKDFPNAYVTDYFSVDLQGKALEDLRSSLFNELRSPDGARRYQQRICGPSVALTFNFLVSVLGKVGFNYPIFLTFIHYIVSWFFMFILKALSMLPASPSKSSRFSTLLALGVVMSLSTGLANVSLKYNSVGFYQMAKIAVTPSIVVAEFVLLRKRVSFQKRYGIQFPQRSQHSAPIITPPVTYPTRAAQVGFAMPTNSSTRLDEAMNSEVEGLSFSTLESMRSVLELLDDMLQAVNPNERMAVKDEVIVDLVDRCRANQKKLLRIITTTTDEELLVKGIEMNDAMQLVLGKHDAIASGAPLPNNGVQPSELANSSIKTNEATYKSPASDAESSGSAAPVPKDQAEEEEEEDEFAQLARRHTKAHSKPSQSTTSGATEDVASSSSNALTVIDVPEPTTTNDTTKDQSNVGRFPKPSPPGFSCC